MKKINLILTLLLLASYTSNAQNKIKPENFKLHSRWSIAAIAGGIVPFGKFGNLYGNSFSAGAEIAYLAIGHFQVFFNPQYNFLSVKDNSYAGVAGYLELVAGGRMNFGKIPEIFFVEYGLGEYLHFLSSNTYTGNSESNTNGYFGMKLGTGGNIPISQRTVFFLKSDFHYIFSPDYNTDYLGIYAGIRYIL